MQTLPRLPDIDGIAAATRNWLEKAVLGLKLCPFAQRPWQQGLVRIEVTDAANVETLLDDLRLELTRLRDVPASVVETTLLVAPGILENFLDFNDFLELADMELENLELDGALQIASFHPDFQFADTRADDIENCTNRAPYPTLHLLRESSIEAVTAGLDDPDQIYRNNIETLRRLGRAGWDALWEPAR